MRIAQIHLFQHELPVRNGPYRVAGTDVWSLTTTLVKLVSDNGLVGWGETCPIGATYAESHAAGAVAALSHMAPGLRGVELQPVPLHRRMDGLLNGHRYAKAAVDIAAHDLAGKHLGVRVCDLLGGATTDLVPSYFATGVETPERTAELAADKVAEGFPRLQVKIGGRAVEEDIESIRRVWEVIRGSGMAFAVDGNRSLTTRDALRISRECLDIPFVLEQPCDSIEELRTIRSKISHSI